MEEIHDINLQSIIESKVDRLFMNPNLKASCQHLYRMSSVIIMADVTIGTHWTLRMYGLTVENSTSLVGVVMDSDAVSLVLRVVNQKDGVYRQ
jgi:hypothetical protein